MNEILSPSELLREYNKHCINVFRDWMKQIKRETAKEEDMPNGAEISNRISETTRDARVVEEPVSTHFPARIEKVANGFIVVVGCRTFVAASWEEASKGLALYWKDPIAAEKKYVKE